VRSCYQTEGRIQEHRFGVVDNRVLRGICGPRREGAEVTGGWRELHNKEIHLFFFISFIYTFSLLETISTFM
jgi:hypothetical protein